MISRDRDRADRCPGVCRPWIAEDGALVRIRLIGGRTTATSLRALAAVAAAYGDPVLHLTKRANVQVRGLPVRDGVLDPAVAEALHGTGLIPSAAHELVRNVMASPLTGIEGGLADLRPVTAELDRLLCADPALAGLPGRFLFVLDDGRGDLVERSLDLGLVAVDGGRAQLRAGSAGWGPVVALADAPAALVALAHAFLDARGSGSGAAWHVDELAMSLVDGVRDHRVVASGVRPAYGRFAGFEHRAVPDGLLTPELLAAVEQDEVVVTPWHGLVLPAR